MKNVLYNHVADVPRLLGGGFHSDFQQENKSPTETLRSKTPCDGCNRRKRDKLA